MTELVLFQTERDTLYPLTLTRPAHSLVYSFRTVLSHLRRSLGTPVSFILPSRLADYYKEREPKASVNSSSSVSDALLVNSTVKPTLELLKEVSALEPGSAICAGNVVVAARLLSAACDTVPQKDMLARDGVKIRNVEANALLRPWDLVSSMESVLEGRGVIQGDNVTVEQPVYLDTSKGPVLIGEGAVVEAFTRIQGPSIIGRRSVVHSARINGHTFIGENCRIGGEVEGSVVSAFTNKAHHGYLGHSYVGEWVNIGAGAVTSDLKNTYGNVRMKTVDAGMVDTGLTKLGSLVCDYSKVSIGTLVYAGKWIGAGSHAYGLVDEDVPPFVSFGKSTGMGVSTLRIDSVVETARRMKRRRKEELSAAEEAMLRLCFQETSQERASS